MNKSTYVPEYYQANKKKFREYKRRYREKHGDKVRAYKRDWYSNNKERERERVKPRQREWYLKNSEKILARQRERYRSDKAYRVKLLGQQREKKYGISRGGIQSMLQSQSFECANKRCRAAITELSCHVDHCHNGNGVRGLLCRGCNIALGMISDSRERALGLFEYLTPLNGN